MKILNILWDKISKTNKSLRLTTLLVPLYDMLFYILAYFGIRKYIYAIKEVFLMLQSPEIMALMSSLTQGSIEGTYAVLQDFYAKLFGYTFLMLIFLLVIWSLSRYLIWQNITGKRFNLKSMLKFIPANALWLGLISIPVIMMFVPFYSYIQIYGQAAANFLPPKLQILRILLLILIFLICYFTNIMHMMFLKTGKVFSSIIQAFKRGVLSYIMLLAYTIVSIIVYMLSFPIKNLGTFGSISYLIVVLASFTWVKVFFNAVIEK